MSQWKKMWGTCTDCGISVEWSMHPDWGKDTDLRGALDSLLRPLARAEYEATYGRPYPDDDGEDHYPALVPVILTRYQVDAWAGRDLTCDEVDRLTEAIPNSSIPDAVATITETMDA